MKKIAKILLLALFSATLLSFATHAVELDVAVESTNDAVLMAEESGRVYIPIMDGWKFRYKATNGDKISIDDSLWENVTLPHTWNAKDGSDGGNSYAKGDGWYRKQLEIPASFDNTKIYLEFEGVNSETKLYVDGTLVPFEKGDGTVTDSHRGGYTKFRYDITDVVIPGSTHLIAVSADNTINPEIAPIAGDWTFFGGIYREVWLVSVPEVHIDMMNYGSNSVFVTPKKVNDTTWTVEVKTVIANDSRDDMTVSVNTVMREPETFLVSEYVPESLTPFDEDTMYGTQIINSASENITVPGRSKVTYSKTFTVTNPRLWNGLEDPYRYQFDVTVTDGTYTDKVSEYAGFRTIAVDADEGFFLNGEYVALRGVSRHQDRKGLGWAITEKEHDEDFGMIYEIGANAIRLAHYPHDQYFYDLCDRYGIVTWAEVPFITDIGGTGEYGAFDATREKHVQNVKEQIVEMIRSNYNRPAISFWGLQNELRPDYDSILQKLIPELDALAKQEDPSRITTFASYHDTAYNWKADTLSWNYYPGWYGYHPSEFTDWYKKYHERYPDVPIGISEFGAGGGIRYHTDEDPVINARPESFGDKIHPEEYQTYVHREIARQLNSDELKFLWGAFIWNMFDFASDNRDEGDYNGINDKGLVTYGRLVKKDSFYVYKALWSKDPFVHIDESRFTVRELEKIPVRITSNCESVRIKVNGVDFGEPIQNDGVGQFLFEKVPLNVGVNTVEAIATDKDGNTYTETVTWTREISDNTVLVSTMLNVDNDKKSIVLRQTARAERIEEFVQSRFNATFTVLAKDRETVITSGIIEPRMYLRVTAEDGVTYTDYMFLANNLAFGKTIYFNDTTPMTEFTDGISEGSWWTDLSNYPDLTFHPVKFDVDLGDVYHINKVIMHIPHNTYHYEVYLSNDGIDYTLAYTQGDAGLKVEMPLGDVMGRYVRILYSKGTYCATCTEVEVHGWKFTSNTYEVDETNNIIITNTGREVVDVQSFLVNCAIDGNCVYSLNSGAYYISDGDVLTITGNEGGKSRYIICTGDGCTNSHASDVALNRPIIDDPGCEGSAYHIRFVNDGEITTRWSAKNAIYPVHFTIDLERHCNIEYFDLTMFAYEYVNNRAYLYEILVSNDNENWTQVVDNTNNNDFSGLYKHYMDNPVVARYVRLNFVGRKINSTVAGTAGVYNFSVYGTVHDGKLSGIEVKETTMYMGVGNVEKILVQAVPSFLKLPADVKFVSSNTGIAEVDSTGIITAKAVGSCKVTVSSASTGFSCEIDVNVDTKKNLSIGRTLHSASNTSGQGLGHYPENIIDGHSQKFDGVDSRWHSSSKEYPQYAIIDLERICRVEEIKVDMFGSQFPGNRYYGYKLYAGRTVDNMTLIVDNSGNTDTSGVFTHTLSTPSVARYVKIEVTGCSIDSGAGVNEVTVYGAETNVSLLGYEIIPEELLVGEHKVVSCNTVPTGADVSEVTFTSSDENIIKIVDNKLLGVAVGEATISAYDKDGFLLDSETISVVLNKLLSLGKPISDYDNKGVESEYGTGFVNTVDKLTDGRKPTNDFNFERWHHTNRDTHYAVVDLGKVYEVNQFTSYFFYYPARAHGYRISVSENGTDFIVVVDKFSDTTVGLADDTLENYVKARYVKLELTPPTAGGSASSTAGCYEFEIYGREVVETPDEPEVPVVNYAPEAIKVTELKLGADIGIRAKASVPSSYRTLEDAVEYGFIATSTGILEESGLTANDLTFDLTSIPLASGVAYKKDIDGNVTTDTINSTKEDGSVVFACALTGITESDYETYLTVRPYLKTTSSEGVSVTYYGEAQSVSVYSVAKAIKKAGYTGLSSWKIKDIDAIVDAVEEGKTAVDLVMFMGQSNMAGRGTASEATVCAEGHGYEFRAVSDPTKLYNIEEPFGAAENNSAVTDTRKTGSLVSAFCETYYNQTERPIVAVSCAQGATASEFWKPDGAALNEAISRYNSAVAYLENNNYVIENRIMVWYQGCGDGENGVSADTYTANTKAIFDEMMDNGIEICGMIQIGPYSYIRNAQSAICDESSTDGIIMLSTLPNSLEKQADGLHLTQASYNTVGEDAAENLAAFLSNK